jgi:hypothetical protein
MNIKEINVENIVRSVAIIVIGLPASIGIGNFFTGVEESLHEATHSAIDVAAHEQTKAKLKGEVAEDCLNWFFSEKDSKVETSAKAALDDRFGGKIDHANICNWAVNN